MSAVNQRSVQALFDCAVETGTEEVQRQADRKPEGTYTNGYRDSTASFTRELGGYKIVATTVTWLTMNLAADKNGVRFALNVFEGDEVAFSATREGDNFSKNFGAEERYIGTDFNQAGEWVVTEGEFPQTLEAVFV